MLVLYFSGIQTNTKMTWTKTIKDSIAEGPEFKLTDSKHSPEEFEA
jgi:hypothetical protein